MIIEAPKNAQLPTLRALWQEAFGDSDAFLDVFERTAFSPDRCRCLTLDNAPVAALYWFDCTCRGKCVAYLYAVATAKTHRGRGLCTALMADTHHHLKTQGYAGTLLVPGSRTLFDFYKKMGYVVCSHVAEFTCSAKDSPVEAREIDADTYAALRRKFLPTGGVIQEKESLAFLQTQAGFYVGKSFLLAARREGSRLQASELLGDVAVAPAILAALCCTEGKFRAPGNDRPFAMYRPLDPTAPPPTYFGLAFD